MRHYVHSIRDAAMTNSFCGVLYCFSNRCVRAASLSLLLPLLLLQLLQLLPPEIRREVVAIPSGRERKTVTLSLLGVSL